MDLNNNIYNLNSNPNFGYLGNMNKSTRKAVLKGLQNRNEIREYITLKNINKASKEMVRVEINPDTNRLYGEIWQPNSTFIRYADYQDKNTKTIDFFRNLFNRTNKE